MTGSPYDISVDSFNKWLAQATSRSLRDLSIGPRHEWKLCVSCRIILQKASSFFSPHNFDLPRELCNMLIFDHYPQFEFLLESGLTCGLCYLFIYSLKHETGDLKVSYNEFLNPLLELSAMRRMKDLPTPIQVVFVFDHDSKETILPNSHSFQITCGIEDGPQWAGPSICWSPIAGKTHLDSLNKYTVHVSVSISVSL